MPLVVVLVTGSRKFKDWPLMRRSLAVYPENTVLIHGAAPGADMIADEVGSKLFGFTVIPMPAQWDVLGSAAGPIRNQWMLDVLRALQYCGYAAYVEAFPAMDSRGTRDMIKKVEKIKDQAPMITLNIHEV